MLNAIIHAVLRARRLLSLPNQLDALQHQLDALLSERVVGGLRRAKRAVASTTLPGLRVDFRRDDSTL